MFGFECYALDVSHQRKEAFGLGKDYFNKLITKKIYYEKLRSCANTGNKTCFSLLGIEYFLDHKYSQAHPLLIKGEDFNVMRYCFLGHMFGDGLGVLQNQNKAITYYKKGAVLGDRDSAYSLGVLYANKAVIAVKESTNLALKFSKQAYIWFKISYALGQKYSFKLDGTKEPMTISLEKWQETIGLRRSKEADKTASQICLKIAKFIQ